jgi:hypothetical protein
MKEHPQSLVFHADLEVAYSEVEITLDDPPIFAFVRAPFNFARPLPRDDLRALAEGRFGADLDAQLRACTLPPSPPLSDGDRERIVRLADEAWSAVSATDDAAPAVGATGSAPDADRPPPAPVPRRALKVLLTLRPDGPDAYRALVGVGADGCDPHFGATDEPLPLDQALGAVPEIVAAAEARWRAAPRHPTVATATKGTAPTRATATRAAARKPAEAAVAATDDTPPATVAAPAPARPAARNQLTLFG